MATFFCLFAVFLIYGSIFFYVVWFRYDELLEIYKKAGLLKQLAIELFFRNPNFPGHKELSRFGVILFIPITIVIIYALIRKLFG